MTTESHQFTKCLQIGHRESELKSVCLECSPPVLVCSYCTNTEHKNHNSKSIHQCLQDIAILKSNLKLRKGQSQKFIRKAIEVQKTSKEQIRLLKESIEVTLGKLEGVSKEYFKTLESKLREELDNFSKQVESLPATHQNNLQLLKKQIKNYVKCSTRSLQLERQIQFMTEELNQYPNLLQKNIKEAKSKIDATANQLKSFSTVDSHLFGVTKSSLTASWDQQMKHKDIKIEKEKARRNQRNQGDSSVCALLKTVDTKNNIDSWAIKIVSLKGWISIGICLDQQLKKIQFKKPQWSKLSRHGCYLLNSDGNVFSNHEKQISASCKCFTFSQGNIIEIDYDRNKRRNKIRFSKKFTDEQFQMDVHLSTSGQTYRPCVFLWLQDDIVEIVPRVS